jgi:hypothetical protein
VQCSSVLSHIEQTMGLGMARLLGKLYLTEGWGGKVDLCARMPNIHLRFLAALLRTATAGFCPFHSVPSFDPFWTAC